MDQNQGIKAFQKFDEIKEVLESANLGKQERIFEAQDGDIKMRLEDNLSKLIVETGDKELNETLAKLFDECAKKAIEETRQLQKRISALIADSQS